MICACHGLHRTLSSLRELTHVGATGTSMLDLAQAAEALGFTARGVQVDPLADLEDLDGLLPAIAHWGNDHFVVLYAVQPKEVIIGDPASGLRRIARDRLGDDWQGILLLLEPTANLQQARQHPQDISQRKTAIRRFFKGLLRYRLLLAQILLATLLLQAIGLAQPFLLQGLIDKVIGPGNIGLLPTVAIALIVLAASQIGMSILRNVALYFLSSRYSLLLLAGFWQQLLSLPMRFFAQRHRGDLLQRIEDQQRVQRILQGAAASFVLDLLALVSYAVLLWTYDARVFAMFVAASALYAGWTLLFLARRGRLDHEHFRARAEVNRAELQMLSGMQTLKACNAERQMRSRWEHLRLRDFMTDRKIWLVDTLHQSGAMLIQQAMYLGIVLYEAQLVLANTLTLGQMMATIAILGLLVAPLQNLVSFVHEVQEVMLSLDRLEIVYAQASETQEEPAVTAGAPKSPPAPPHIVADHVSFFYGSPNDTPIIDGASFTIPAGKMTAIVGRSGAGKTTLGYLLYGLFPVQHGRITYDGMTMQEIGTTALRRSAAFVFQQADIFEGTLAENIALGDPTPDRTRILHAAQTACLDDLLRMALGLDTKIGESGIRLSGGEEQRVQLARAIYRHPRVLFLDEATSHLDAQTEQAITEALQRESQGRTLIVIAHRLSTIRSADWIIVLERGRVVEQGRHEDLLMLETGHYRALMDHQLESA